MISLLQSLQELDQSSRLFFVLSGEHSSLPAAEVRAILESNRFEYGNESESYRLLTLSAPVEALKPVSERSLMYDSNGLLLGESEADNRGIERLVKSLPMERLTESSGTFAVRSIRLGGVNKSLGRVNLERDVGSIIKELVPRLAVRLRDPDLTFVCIISKDKCLLGASLFRKPSGLIAPRLPRRRPAFHPSTMPPKIARCMVNLARSVPGGTFADPFSGVGGIVLEAAVIGSRIVGSDANLRMLRGARRNLKHFGFEAEVFLNSDARYMPLRELDAIATDPPYGRGSSTMGMKVNMLIREFLEEAKSSLKKSAHLCISAPVEVNVEDYSRQAGFKVKERHTARVHRSLTRQFVVLQNS
jgi:tRNA (guanine10-N2)-dimethyltransferase